MREELAAKFYFKVAEQRQEYVRELLESIASVYRNEESIVLQFIIGTTDDGVDTVFDQIEFHGENDYIVLTRRNGLLLASITSNAKEILDTITVWKNSKEHGVFTIFMEDDAGVRSSFPVVLLNYVFADVLDKETNKEHDRYPSYSLGVPSLLLEDNYTILDALSWVPEEESLDALANVPIPTTLN